MVKFFFSSRYNKVDNNWLNKKGKPSLHLHYLFFFVNKLIRLCFSILLISTLKYKSCQTHFFELIVIFKYVKKRSLLLPFLYLFWNRTWVSIGGTLQFLPLFNIARYFHGKISIETHVLFQNRYKSEAIVNVFAM